MSVRQKLEVELEKTEHRTPEWVNRWTALTAVVLVYAFMGVALYPSLV